MGVKKHYDNFVGNFMTGSEKPKDDSPSVSGGGLDAIILYGHIDERRPFTQSPFRVFDTGMRRHSQQPALEFSLETIHDRQNDD